MPSRILTVIWQPEKGKMEEKNESFILIGAS